MTVTKPRKRPQQSLDDRANYDAQRRTFEGGSDIKTHPTSQEYRDGWERIFGKDMKHGAWSRIIGTSTQGVSKSIRKARA